MGRTVPEAQRKDEEVEMLQAIIRVMHDYGETPCLPELKFEGRAFYRAAYGATDEAGVTPQANLVTAMGDAVNDLRDASGDGAPLEQHDSVIKLLYRYFAPSAYAAELCARESTESFALLCERCGVELAAPPRATRAKTFAHAPH